MKIAIILGGLVAFYIVVSIRYAGRQLQRALERAVRKAR